MKTLLVIIGIIIAILACLLLIYIVAFSCLGRKIYNNHDSNIKQTIGYDFGDKYELLYSRLRDGMLQVLLFPDDETWVQLLAHCQSIEEGKSIISIEEGEYRVCVNKEQYEYEFNGHDKNIDGVYVINFTITKELNDKEAHTIITIRIDYSKRMLFYDYDSGI